MMNKFDILEAFGIEETPTIGLEDIFYLKELKQRRLFLEEEVAQYSVSDLIHQIMQFNMEDAGVPVEERKPILLYIATEGGSVDAGFELIDAIRMSKTPVFTINVGYEYSMGFLIGISGHKRFAFPSAKFLLHDGSNIAYGSSTKVQDQLEFNRKIENRIKELVVSRTNITAKEYDKNLRVEWYMFADEAKKRGVIDAIIGEDCDIDAVL